MTATVGGGSGFALLGPTPPTVADIVGPTRTTSPLRCDVSLLGPATILRIQGRLDDDVEAQLRVALRRLLEAPIAVLVVDLLDMTTIGRACAATLAAVSRKARRCRVEVRVLADHQEVLGPLRSSGGIAVCDTRGGTTPHGGDGLASRARSVPGKGGSPSSS